MKRLPATLNPLHARVLLAVMALLSGPCPASAEIGAGPPALEVATYEQTATLQFYQRFIKEAYLRLGIGTRFTVMPALRAAHSTNRGELDALLLASTDVETDAPNIARVTEPLPSFDFRVLARSDMPGETLPPDLGPYSVAYIRGIHPLERIFAGKSQKLTVNSDFETLVEILLLERVDLVALPALEASMLVQRHQGLKVLQEPVYTVTIFHYLHQDHEALAAPLAEAFSQLKRNEPCMATLTRLVMNVDDHSSDTALLDVVNPPGYGAVCQTTSD